jgi:hypothetical protein
MARILMYVLPILVIAVVMYVAVVAK